MKPLNLSLPFIQNKPLSSVTTLGIGGPACIYVEVRGASAMQEAICQCHHQGIPFFILGKGSNSLFDDRGFNGCVIHNKIDFIECEKPGIFKAGGGYSFSLLGTKTAREGWSGLEFASGIPGSVGGAVFMNAGANGLETKDFLLSVDFIDHRGSLHTYTKDEIVFRYRYSSFQELKGAIISASFALFDGKTPRQNQLKMIRYRQATQPYLDKSAGCIFRNPEGASAGKLIESCGLKGYAIGDAQVSSLHANFLINAAHASSQDFKALIEYVRASVKEKTGIELECELRTVPYDI